MRVQGVETATFEIGGTAIELVQGTTDGSPIRKFVETKGPGIHHIAFAVGDVEDAIAALKKDGLRLIDETPKPGKEGSLIAFIHPKSTQKILFELVEPAKKDDVDRNRAISTGALRRSRNGPDDSRSVAPCIPYASTVPTARKTEPARAVAGRHDLRSGSDPKRVYSNLIPCASGSSFDQLIVFVCRRMYAFHESEPGLAAAAGLLLAAERAADLGARRADVHVRDTAVRALVRQELLGVQQVRREDRRREALRHFVVPRDRVVQLLVLDEVENRREGLVVDDLPVVLAP